MAQTDMDRRMSLSLLAENWTESKEQSVRRSAQSSASCRRSGRSPALPYLPHEWHESNTTFDQPLAKGTSLLCRKGDISTLH
jgi:hypothetical protein